MIDGVKFVSIPAVDQTRALEFYTTKLGFIVKTDATFGAQRWIELEIPGSTTRVVLFNMETGIQAGGSMNVNFHSSDIDATAQQLTERGVEILEGPTKQGWGSFLKFKDSEGNLFVVSAE